MGVSGVSAYGVLNVRVRAGLGEMLAPETFARMDGSPDVASILAILRDTVYGRVLSKADEGDANPRRITYLLRTHLTEKFEVVVENAPKVARPLIEQLFRLYEVDNLKATFRSIQAKDSWDKLSHLLFPMGGFITLPYERMLATGSVPDVIGLLENTPYGQPLKAALPRFLRENDLFAIEVNLDLDYWAKTWKLIDDLPGGDRRLAHDLIGEIIERNDLLWATRFFLYYKLSAAEILNYTLGIGPKVPDEVIGRISQGEPLKSVLASIYPELRPKTVAEGAENLDVSHWEIELHRMYFRHCRSKLVGPPFNLGVSLAYLFLLEYEIEDIILLLEAKAMGLPRERYSSYLINKVFQS